MGRLWKEIGKILSGDFGKMKKLNLGCGKSIKKGWTNLDLIKGEGVDVVWDLDKTPYKPLKDNEFDFILAEMVLEHTWEPDKVIKELWRISKKGGEVKIIVPHFSNWQAWGDITHRRPFNSTSLFSFSSRKSHRGSTSLINVQKEIFDINSKITFGKIKRFFGFEYFFNLNNYARGFYERNLSYFFPAESIIFNLKTLK